MYYQFRDPAYVKGVYAALAWYVAGLAYFGLVGRHRLVLSPEETIRHQQGNLGRERVDQRSHGQDQRLVLLLVCANLQALDHLLPSRNATVRAARLRASDCLACV